MNYVESLNLFGIPAKEIPCITGSGKPATNTEGAVGSLYMDTTNGAIYKCVAVNGNNYTWENTEKEESTTESNILKEEVDSVIDRVQDNPADFRIVTFADPHSYDPEKYKKYNDLLSSGCIDAIVGLGDYQIYSSKLTKVETIKKYTEMLSYAGRTPNCFYAIGNHDIAYRDANGATPDQSKILTKKELFDCLYRHNTTACFNDADPYGGYFYVDFNASKIRLIVLNTSDIYEPDGSLQCKYSMSVMMQQPQITWLVNTALDFNDKATPADWSVLVCQHACFDKSITMLADILSAVKSGTALNKSWSFKKTLDNPETSGAANLLPIEAATSNSYSGNGITITHNNGRLTVNGTSTNPKSFEIVTRGEDYGELQAGVTYTLSLNPVSGVATANLPAVVVRTRNADGTETPYQTADATGVITFTPSENCTLIRFAIMIGRASDGFTDYVFEPTLTAAGDISGGADESQIVTTISASKDFSEQGAVDVIGVLYGHDHLDAETVSSGIHFIKFICDNNEMDDFYVASVNGLAAGDYFFTTTKGVKMAFTLSSALPNVAVIGYNNYFARYGIDASLRFQDVNGNTIDAKPTKATAGNYADGMTEITGFVQERTPGTAKTESCFVVSVDKDGRSIKIVPYGTGFYREINY